MNGKQKCEMLRYIRKTLAEGYGIKYVPKECDHEECATGTCPLCEQEADFILGELLKRGKTGELNKDDLKFFKDLDTLFDEPTDKEDEDLLPMGIPAPFDEEDLVGEIDDEPEELMGDMDVPFDYDDQDKDGQGEIGDEPVALMGDIIADPEDDDQDGDEQENDDHPLPRP